MTSMKLGDLKSNPRNPRKISQKQLELLKNGLDKFGDLSCIVYNKSTNRIVAGHQRIKVLPFDLEIKQLVGKPYGYVEHNGERFTVRFVEWDEDTEKAANILANKAGGEFDNKLLADWLLELDAKNFDIENTGFTMEEFEDICAPFKPEEPYDPEDDFVPEVKEGPSICQPGDLWQLGDHRLLCGDSNNIEDLKRVMDGNKVDMVFTDPPYGMDVVKPDGNIGGTRKKDVGKKGYGKVECGVYKSVIGDDKPFNPSPLLTLCELQIIWGANHFSDKLPTSPHWIVWNKEMPEGTDFSGAELAWTNINKKAVKVYKFVWAGMTRQGDRTEELLKRVHPTQKPVGLFTKILNDYDPKSVIDPYLGSGSTLIACEKTKTTCYGVEIDPYYCDVIIARWEKFSGKKAVKI